MTQFAMRQSMESTDQMLQKRVELILQQLEGVGALPEIASVILTTPAGNESAINNAIEKLSAHASICDPVLRLIGTIISEPVASAASAVERVGFEPVRNAVIAVGAYQAFT